jgi:hemerythrin-like domain-containing protein
MHFEGGTVMPNIIDAWKKDHCNFSQLLDMLEVEVRRHLDDQAPDYELMLDILYYMIHYSDTFHHPKEDLVSERIRELDTNAEEVVNELMRQHVILRESGAQLHGQLEAILEGAMLKRTSIVEPATTYISYFRSHMKKEEAEIFPLAHKLLSAADWAVIEKEAPFKDDPLFGHGALEKEYERLYQQINREIMSVDPA